MPSGMLKMKSFEGLERLDRPPMNDSLELEAVQAGYGLSRVLHGVTLSARAGEVVSLLGRSRVGVGYVPEDRRIFGDLTVEENLTVGAKGDGIWSEARVYRFFPKLLELAGRRAGSLSGGEQQMLTVARTLMGNPRVLLLDEPSEGLAPVIVRALGDQIAALKREGLTILLSEQNLKFAARLADRAYIIEKGEIRWEGPMGRLLADEAIRRAYLTV